mmetsp:Transcript_9701/g.18500  ORF Transcript_9701/g.18500 Transcript_9701/m.18500 type:complete len:820 (+) Transcript_9701:37-2496(+)|eukprot:CAMPEP_0175141058 /NCGR_PEP_ID=MMETSP0087-20121206/11872_1 /TAXON_ID=136419 /ORGANISM="Unknown Unknown, Strain D1" /LENGTH=819 /DNA_ID=CAMNT_0016424387 /DNA_START=37 /DNA_END=2496 /DNA_ORIENTATION=+
MADEQASAALKEFYQGITKGVSDQMLTQMCAVTQTRNIKQGQQETNSILQNGFFIVMKGALQVLGAAASKLVAGTVFGAYNAADGFLATEDTVVVMLPPNLIGLFVNQQQLPNQATEADSKDDEQGGAGQDQEDEKADGNDESATRANVAAKNLKDLREKQIRDTTKSSKESWSLMSWLQNVELFDGMNEQHRMKVVKEMWRHSVEKGEVVVKQGEVGDNFYVIAKGKFEVLVNSHNGAEMKKIGVIKKGCVFGELALLFNTPRSCTVRCAKKGVVWGMDRFTFRAILTNLSHQKLNQIEGFLENCPLFAEMDRSDRAKLAEAVDEKRCSDHQVICKEGDVGECLYIVMEGKVQASGSKVIGKREYTRYEYFGEGALVHDSFESTATYITVEKTDLLKLDRHVYDLLLGEAEKVKLSRKMMGEKMIAQTQTMVAEALDLSMSTPLDMSTVKKILPDNSIIAELYHDRKAVEQRINDSMFSEGIAKADLETVGILGNGSFGTVEMVKHRHTGEIYALKIITRHRVHETDAHENILNEKRMAEQMNHPCIIRLHATYVDDTDIYFLQEPALGGELFEKLRRSRLRRFDNNTARFYVASVILAFEYMHSKEIIYRDLKPENILLDGRGYAKVTDLGFAKQIPKGRTWTLCGTPAYLAPEMLTNKPHGKAVDWWCVGIFMFELLAGTVPFKKSTGAAGQPAMRLFDVILRSQPKYPSYFKPEAVDLISQFLVKKPLQRMGVRAGGVDEIMKHSWFKGFDWKALVDGKMRAPIIPFIDDRDEKEMLLSNFGLQIGRKGKGKEQSMRDVDYGDAFAQIDAEFDKA